MEVASDVVKANFHNWKLATRNPYEIQIDFKEPFMKHVLQTGSRTTLCVNFLLWYLDSNFYYRTSAARFSPRHYY